MEETGIIRRLDALGRIVIPREYRKLHRIEVGDPLEMRALEGGEIILRKVDVSARLRSVGSLAVSSLAQHVERPVAVCSPDVWLEFAGHREWEGKPLPALLAEAVAGEKTRVLTCEEAGLGGRYTYATVFPVTGETGVFGALVLFGNEQPTATEKALCDTVARFTGKSLQTF